MTVKVAVVQMDPQLGQVEHNLARVRTLFESCLAQGVYSPGANSST